MTYPPLTCPNGHRVADAQQRFCEVCGAPIGTGVVSPGSSRVPPPPAHTQRVYVPSPGRAYPARRGASRRTFDPMIVVVVALLSVAGVLGAIVFQLSQGSSPGSSPGGIAGASGSPALSPGTTAARTASPAAGTSVEPSAPADGSPAASGSPAGSPAPSKSPAIALVRCASEANQFTIGYPKAWHTVENDAMWTCMLFDREPITIEPATELPPVAVLVSAIATPLDTVYAGITDATFWKPLSKPVKTKVAGQAATRLELVATGEGYEGAGALAYMYMFERDGTTYILETHGAAGADGKPNPQGPEYKANKRILDAMAKSMKLT